ncbi:MAG: hypothetical protein ACLQPH_18135, partial [Acidimicrobiales bacterium]
MTEEQNDQTAEQPASSSEPETAPTPVPETTGQAIALPATTPPPPPELPQQPTELPQQPDTPPMGLPQGSDIPQGSLSGQRCRA